MFIWIVILMGLSGTIWADGTRMESWEAAPWRRLLYASSGDSLVDDTAFFLGNSPSLQNEWFAFKELLTAADAQDSLVPCRFPARTKFMVKQLGMRAYNFSHCRDYLAFKAELDVDQVSIVFPTSYFGDPASMFGHTMLKFQKRGQQSPLGHAVSFGAKITDPPGISYALKGIFGLYPGYFSVVPYYEAMNLYREREDRDLWVLDLSLSQQQVELLTDHLWELRATRIDYYFFTENCAKLLIDFLAVAEPTIEPSEFKGAWLVPIDVVNYLHQLGLVNRENYLASLSQRIFHQYHQLSASSQEKLPFASGIKEAAYESLDRLDQARLINLWADLVRYKFQKGDLDRRAYAHQYLQTLHLRSKTEIRLQSYEPSPTYSLLRGHYPRLLAYGIAQGEYSGGYLRFRPVLHGVGDSSEGFNAHMILSILDTRLAFFDGQVVVQQMDLFHLANWGSYIKVIPSLSWEVLGQYQRDPGGLVLEYLLGRTWGGGALMGMLLGGGRTHVDAQNARHSLLALGRVRHRWLGLSSNLELRYRPQALVKLEAASILVLSLNSLVSLGFEARLQPAWRQVSVELKTYF